MNNIPLYRTDINKLLGDSIDKVVFINRQEEKTPMGNFVNIVLSVNASNNEKSILIITTPEAHSGSEKLKEVRRMTDSRIELLANEFLKNGYIVEQGSGYLPCKVTYDKFFEGTKLKPIFPVSESGQENKESEKELELTPQTNKGRTKK